MDVRSVLSKSQLLNGAPSEHFTKNIEAIGGTGREKADAPDSQQTGRQKNIDKEEAKNIVDGLNEFLAPSRTSIQFQFHEKLNEYYVTIVDTESKEVIREIPPKKLLDIYAAMAEFMGLIVDKKI
ncbi:flagellar protein FlaG [Melghiribacillus thermohalophilus]|uniref:Flagellar protein FlaG n=1 Tax=Melghiribacillus thermohalophilus TaxID=1324956 RepID=A0A4R3N0A1_9BACI|nr:flagellar protein FlaG [Melghiribacillus thermohalophilus]TCT20443.1 flagellar protein FlaG [Melghiribacillus thermohalophilus]